MFGRLLAGTHYIYILGLLPPSRILSGAKFTLRPSLAFSYIGSVSVWHSSSGRRQNVAAWYLYATGWPSRLTLSGRTVSFVVTLLHCVYCRTETMVLAVVKRVPLIIMPFQELHQVKRCVCMFSVVFCVELLAVLFFSVF